jgi:putative flavoprotein involved in K+ transport
MHSSEYRDPSQLAPGGVLIVGAGNSGADIAIETSKAHPTWLSGRDKGEVPVRIESRLARFVIPVLWFLASHLLTVRTPLGRKLKPRVLANGSPRVRVRSKDLKEAGVVLAPKTIGVRDGRPVLADGRILEVANVIWATGFRQDYNWIDLPVYDADGAPAHERGVASEPGLYFVGLDFMYAATSENVGGVGRDARHVARHIARLSSRHDS